MVPRRAAVPFGADFVPAPSKVSTYSFAAPRLQGNGLATRHNSFFNHALVPLHSKEGEISSGRRAVEVARLIPNPGGGLAGLFVHPRRAVHGNLDLEALTGSGGPGHAKRAVVVIADHISKARGWQRRQREGLERFGQGPPGLVAGAEESAFDTVGRILAETANVNGGIG